MNLTIVCVVIIAIIEVLRIYLKAKGKCKVTKSSSIWDSVLIILMCMDVILISLP